MNVKPLPLAALAAAAVLSTMAIADAIWNANVPGRPGPWMDAESFDFLARALNLAHSGVYVLFAAALLSTGQAIDRGRLLARLSRWILVAGYAAFAVAFAWLGAVDPHRQPEGVFATLVNVAFMITLVAPIILGFALIRRRELRAAVILLISPVALIPMTILLGLIGPWGHPAYLESAIGFGVALLCVSASTSSVSDSGSSHDARTHVVVEGR
ncbi:hypothetical protein [Occultella kanbiaonis]|uniref:hypothetical protein n=1 Tax=Occultella kanbiaonis TaxID=2675754 RepID=UPI0013D5C0EC|nr:hypothetical protein [Occultella kanbiaonis]